MKHEEIVALAFCIADESMLELLLAHTVHVSDELRGLVDEKGAEVAALALADPAIEEAFEWLSLRGMAELATDSNGELIKITVDTQVNG